MQNYDVDTILSRLISDMDYAKCVVDQLHLLGYTNNFEVSGNKLICIQTRQTYLPKDMQVDEVYQFEKETKGLQGYFLYAIRNKDRSVMGIFTAYPAPDF